MYLKSGFHSAVIIRIPKCVPGAYYITTNEDEKYEGIKQISEHLILIATIKLQGEI